MENCSRMCRVCLAHEKDEKFASIFDNIENCEILYDFGNVLIEEIIDGDEVVLPALICKICQQKLNETRELKEMLTSSQNFFQQKISNICDFKEKAVENYEYEIIDSSEMNLDQVKEELVTIKEELMSADNDKVEEKEDDGAIHHYFCEYCDRKFLLKTRLQDHCVIQHKISIPERIRECPICNKVFPVESYLRAHIRNVHVEREILQCEICNKNFKTRAGYIGHVRSKHQEIKSEYICDKCGEIFKQKSYLYQHMMQHMKSKYVCKICSRGFYKKHEYEDHHIIAHTDQRPFICNYENCNKTFTRQKNLNIHMRVHTGHKPYTCFFCDRDFKHNSDRKKHMINHHHDQEMIQAFVKSN